MSIFRVCLDEDYDPLADNDFMEIYANNTERAAQLFCRKFDRDDGEFTIIDSGEATVVVVDEDDVVHWMSVVAWDEPQYSASPREE